jgi:hypothetical protein
MAKLRSPEQNGVNRGELTPLGTEKSVAFE